MTDNRNNGGPAFPRAGFSGPRGYGRPEDGMTLRDWFAGQALAASGSMTFTPKPGESATLLRAEWAYFVADMMLEARNK